MKRILPIATSLALMGSSNAALDVAATIIELKAVCKSIGANTYVAVRYENTASPVTYDFGVCYPYELPGGKKAQVAVFCKSATYNNNPYVLPTLRDLPIVN